MEKRKAKISKTREVITYAEMRHASHVILDKAEKDSEGSFYLFMASLIFSAFTMEAYLNHLGQHIFKCWDDLGRNSPVAKLNLITEELGIEKDYGKSPYQTFLELFHFRNSVAHGKSTIIKSDKIVEFHDVIQGEMKFLETPWEEYCTSENAKKALADIEIIVKQLHEASGIKDEFPFRFGMQSTLTTLLSAEE